MDDIGATAGLVLKTDEDGDGTFEITWTATDYELEPFGGKLHGRSWAYTTIRVAPRGTRSFPVGRWPGVELTAKFGWPAVPDEIHFAAMVQAGKWHKRKDSPFGVLGSPDTGVVRIPPLDADVTAGISAFVKVEVVAVG